MATRNSKLPPKPAKRAASIRDVASAAHVSVSTVSRALRGYADVSPKTRALVQEMAQQLNYVPNAIGQGLVSGRSNNIAVLFSGAYGPALLGFYSKVLGGIEKVLEDHGLNLVLLRAQSPNALGRLIRGHMADGVAAIGCDLPRELLERLEAAHIPLVLVDQPSWKPGLAAVTVENEHGTYLTTRHLIARGRKRIAFIAENLHDHNFNLRRQGYERALREADLPLDPALVAGGVSSPEGGYVAAKKLLEQARPDAIVGANDMAVLSGMRALDEAGLKVPDDVALVGFDDLELAQYSHPPLTTVHVPRLRMGEETAERLLQRLEGDLPESVTLPVKLIVRNSS